MKFLIHFCISLILGCESNRLYQIPVVDIQAFISLNATFESKQEVARAWDSALVSFGFVSITGHALDMELQSKLFDHAKDFFHQRLDEKKKCQKNAHYGSGGYTPFGVESVSRTLDENESKGQADLVENFAFLPDSIAAIRAQYESEGAMVLTDLERASLKYWDGALNLINHLHDLSSMALELDDLHFFRRIHETNPSYALRLAYYPPIESQCMNSLECDVTIASISTAARAGSVRYGAHTDYQGLTILRPDPLQPGGIKDMESH